MTAALHIWSAGFFARLRIFITYTWQHWRVPRLGRPRRFTDYVQRRKLEDRDPRWPGLMDKVRAKAAVAAQIGAEWIIPTLWHGARLPMDAPWPRPFVVKTRHGCKQIAFVAEGDDWDVIRCRLMRHAGQRYGWWLDEWAYGEIAPGFIVEPRIGPTERQPIDYKLLVFAGRVAFFEVHLDRGTPRHRWVTLDRDWQRVSSPDGHPGPERPMTMDQMISAAEVLAAGIDCVRVDLYEDDGRPLFGEMTFYPGSGLLPFAPPELDLVFGEHWRRARAVLGLPAWSDVPAPSHDGVMPALT